MRTERANAKINLYLNIVSRRENGYHNLESLMQTVSLCDLVTVDFHPSATTKITLRASGNAQMPTDCRNLAWRAAERYLEAADGRGEVQIFIEKHIPMAAGLAGGSADAAAVLRGLNRLCGNRLTVEQLCAIGEKLGADVPFCIVGGTSLVTGIGECLKELLPMPSCYLVVACMGEGVSTPWAYGKLDEAHGNFEKSTKKDPRIDALRKHLEQGDVSTASVYFFNLFEEVVPSVQPYVEKLKQVMNASGAVRSMMSGSGPSVFGIFNTAEHAQAACEALRAMKAEAFVCHPVGKFTEQ